MFKRLINSSVSAVLGRSAQVRGTHHKWISTSVPPNAGVAQAADGYGSDKGRSPLLRARQDFIAALADVQTEQAGDLVKRIGQVHSMRALWYLRTEFFYLIAQHRDQTTAKARLELIDGHFPRRDTRRSSRAFGESES